MRHLTFNFQGGHLDGHSVATDSTDIRQSDDAKNYAVLTAGGRVGRRFRAPSTVNFERIMTGTPTTPDERYEVIERQDDGGWRWIIQLRAIGPGRSSPPLIRTLSDDVLGGLGFTEAEMRNAADTILHGMMSQANDVGCRVRFSPHLDYWEYGDGDYLPIPTPATEEDLRQLLAALRIPT
jgi:hypothetical protein